MNIVGRSDLGAVGKTCGTKIHESGKSLDKWSVGDDMEQVCEARLGWLRAGDGGVLMADIFSAKECEIKKL